MGVLFFAAWDPEAKSVDGETEVVQVESDRAASVETTELSAEQAAASEAAASAEIEASSPAEVVLAAESEMQNKVDSDAKVIVENGIVKFYFATGKADLAQGADDALKDVLAGVREGKKAIVSGFHDSTGNKAKNEELSKQRAFSVRDALLALGVPESQIELRKPENAKGSGNKAEARRVEVVLE
ncbi:MULTISPECIES: OmpA family protein [unclassified Neisseria]|uniref:OmpA family protein n=1 Tax=unclassified Neisseria TaxID=2623750 RepID=UPI002666AFDA|nr:MULTISPECIES: OmpA family protein [unclassified Neisseria]MDO1509435.1 OmpA family protein [Neisseria sp. MVDL19-042950]MDO1515792.1 OmpA family protein [Neisseria sp. MVDL18-041461]MDO1563384.1 OmpA family protein [Neisseria sp. MVDL20-010259]